MTNLEKLYQSLKRKTRMKIRLSKAASDCNSSIDSIVTQIGILEYGKPGERIKFRHSNGVILDGIIAGFQKTVWEDRPMCLIDTTILGRPWQTHILSNKDLVGSNG